MGTAATQDFWVWFFVVVVLRACFTFLVNFVQIIKHTRALHLEPVYPVLHFPQGRLAVSSTIAQWLYSMQASLQLLSTISFW